MQPWPRAATLWHPSQVGRPPIRLIVNRTRPLEGRAEPGRAVVAEGDRLEVGAGGGIVSILSIQPEGKRAMSAGEFLRGHQVVPGDRFGE